MAAPIKIKRGDYKAVKVLLPAVDENTDIIDWTTATFLSQIRKTENSTEVLAEFAIDDNHVAEVPPYVLLILESVTVGAVVGTSDLPAPSTAVMDVQETRNGKPRTPITRKVKIEPDVSR